METLSLAHEKDLQLATSMGDKAVDLHIFPKRQFVSKSDDGKY